MKIIDYSTRDLNPKSQITNLKSQIIEIAAATLIFIIPVLALFILSK